MRWETVVPAPGLPVSCIVELARGWKAGICAPGQAVVYFTASHIDPGFCTTLRQQAENLVTASSTLNILFVKNAELNMLARLVAPALRGLF